MTVDRPTDPGRLRAVPAGKGWRSLVTALPFGAGIVYVSATVEDHTRALAGVAGLVAVYVAAVLGKDGDEYIRAIGEAIAAPVRAWRGQGG